MGQRIRILNAARDASASSEVNQNQGDELSENSEEEGEEEEEGPASDEDEREEEEGQDIGDDSEGEEVDVEEEANNEGVEEARDISNGDSPLMGSSPSTQRLASTPWYLMVKGLKIQTG